MRTSVIRFALGLAFLVGANLAHANIQCAIGTVTVDGATTTSKLCWDDGNHSAGGGTTGGGSTPGGGASGGPPAGATTVTLLSINVTASVIKCELKSKDWNNTEYLGFVFMQSDGSKAMATAVVAGNATVNVLNALNQVGITPSQVISFGHNHPSAVYCTANGWAPTDPGCTRNNIPSVADWQVYNVLRQNGAGNLGQYILGPDGTYRFFDSSNQTPPNSPGAPSGKVVNGYFCS